METPRRRSQNRDEREEQDQNAPEETRSERPSRGQTSDIQGPANCVKAVRVMMQELMNAKKSLINSDNCVVNRSVLQAQLSYLDENLPDTVKKAAEIVRQEETIRTEMEEKRNQILSEAQARGQQMVIEANSQAQSTVDKANQEAKALMDRATQEGNALMDRANQEATACVEAARAEAARMLEDADKKARQMIEEENIMRRARVESDEIRQKAQEETTQLRKNTLDFVDRQLMDADRAISEMLNAIRLERNEVRNRR